MARKKYFDENGEDTQQGQRKSQQSVKPNHHFLGGGTKNEFRHSNSKNSDESQSHDGAVGKQLSILGLSIREMPGDGNCLFSSLCDQISGSSRNHLECRRGVVQYMKEFRAHFEPFVDDDDLPFEKYVQRLSQPGCFAGNDAIVAFSKMHNVSVVIHQLNSPAWVIHPKDSPQEHAAGGREVHIFYHNGDHYNSVRRIGDDSETPTNIRLHAQSGGAKPNYAKCSGKKSPPHSACSNAPTSSVSYCGHQYESKRDEDYWVKDSQDIERLVEDVMQQTNYSDPSLIRETLIDYNFDIVATVDFIISMTLLTNQHQYNTVEVPALVDDSNSNKLHNKEKASDIDEVRVLETSSSQTTTSSAAINVNEENTKIVTGMKPPNAELMENSHDANIGSSGDDSQSTESDDNSINSQLEEPVSSQENAKKQQPMTRKEAKRCVRYAKEMKRKERKREADSRKQANLSASCVPDKENQKNIVVVSHLGSLDI